MMQVREHTHYNSGVDIPVRDSSVEGGGTTKIKHHASVPEIQRTWLGFGQGYHAVRAH